MTQGRISGGAGLEGRGGREGCAGAGAPVWAARLICLTHKDPHLLLPEDPRKERGHGEAHGGARGRGHGHGHGVQAGTGRPLGDGAQQQQQEEAPPPPPRVPARPTSPRARPLLAPPPAPPPPRLVARGETEVERVSSATWLGPARSLKRERVRFSPFPARLSHLRLLNRQLERGLE